MEKDYDPRQIANCLTLVHTPLTETCHMDTSDCEEGWELGLAVCPEEKKMGFVKS